ncbi:hypothetical protein ACF9IK_12695 [Kitasatospora hibisci]|uniref:hypothetical protein n=1 Tax=Kitasatospora hibisci TaxID=3369522 RepID=UPI0037554134
MTAPEEQQGRPAGPEQRSGRHAARRTPVRVRLRGRALAMAAVPTALLMAATYTPNAAVAEPAAGKPCASAPDTPVQPPTVAETPVPKSELPPPLPGPSVPLPADPTTAPAAPSKAPAPTEASTTPAAPTAPTSGPSSQAPAPASSPASAPVRSATAGGSGGVVQAGLIDDVVGGITNLLNPSASPSPSASTGSAAPAPAAPSAAPAPAGGNRAVAAPAPGTQAPAPSSVAGPAPAATPSGAASGAPSPAASTSAGSGKTAAKPSAGTKATGSAAPSSGARTPSASASASPSANPNCLVPLKGLSAGDTPDNPILVPDQNWTLQTSRLTLNHAVLMGVVKVQTPTGTKRVLKFVVDSVDIENLDMSTLEGNGKTFHVKGAPGSVSTMRKGPVTMYVERMSGHLSKVLGLPVPIDLGELTLTPDGPLPQWLYDLIGKLEIPLWLEMTGVTAVQAGQFGGTLKIPGMRLYNDDTPYVGNL